MSNTTLHFARTYGNHWYIKCSNKIFYMPELFLAIVKDTLLVKKWCQENDIVYSNLRQRLTQKSKVWFAGETKLHNPKSQTLAREIQKCLDICVINDKVEVLLNNAEVLPPEIENEYENIYHLYTLLFNLQTSKIKVPEVTNSSLAIAQKKLEIAKLQLELLQAQPE